MAALHAVVTIRGYSRICGETSAEMHTGTPSSRAQVVGDHALVGRVDVGVEEAHADRLDLGAAQLGGERVEVGVGSARSTTSPGGVGALGDLERRARGDRRRRELDLQVVHVVAVLVADEQRVAEARRW